MSEQPQPDRRRHVRRAAIAGALLALICHALPPEHREVCRALANVCTGGLL